MTSPSAQDNDFIVVAQSQQSDAPAEHDDADQDQGTYTRQQIQQISTHAKIHPSSFSKTISSKATSAPSISSPVSMGMGMTNHRVACKNISRVLDNTEWGRADWLVFEEVLGISDSDEGQRRFKYRGYYSVNKEYVPTTREARGLQEQIYVSVPFIVEKAADSLPLAAKGMVGSAGSRDRHQVRVKTEIPAKTNLTLLAIKTSKKGSLGFFKQ
ncbi:hypothetical protein D9758_017204 [Tetrapyrgos nigripes]|uniref:Uncharacterized protein n=1 Tax=Tetrapyrgos nigripes TaxID=182062 RepID=A0A8H5C0J7_9AGAR|nr:hypothetical protein D9758_017204 [Tetrapyrgos nigripes]